MDEIAEEAKEIPTNIPSDEIPESCPDDLSQENSFNEASGSNCSDNNNTADMLAKGLLGLFEPPLLAVKSNLNDLIEKQNLICSEVIREKEKLNEAIANEEIKQMMQKLIVYKDKVRKIRSDMLYIHKRTQELKKKAIDMQVYKVEQKANHVQQIHYEQTLIGGSNSKSIPK